MLIKSLLYASEADVPGTSCIPESAPFWDGQAGDVLYTASMTPILTFLEDTGPGVHDTTAAACSPGLYVLHLGEVCALWHSCLLSPFSFIC